MKISDYAGVQPIWIFRVLYRFVLHNCRVWEAIWKVAGYDGAAGVVCQVCILSGMVCYVETFSIIALFGGYLTIPSNK
jgi:hypothetical protein